MKICVYVLCLTFVFLITKTANSTDKCDCGLISVEEYNFPISNPLQATLVGTPKSFKTELNAEVPMEPGIATIFPEREIPELFWYVKGLPFAISAQAEPAPVMYVIAGTGSGHLSTKMIALRNIYYAAGYHVVLLPSPTYPSFISAASLKSVPGRITADVDDLIRVIQVVQKQIEKEVSTTGISLSGYSLGAMQALFIAEKLDRTNELRIEKTIAINPPVSLIESINLLDGMLDKNIPGGMNNVQAFYDRVFGKVAHFYSVNEKLDFSDDFLYKLQRDEDFDDQFMSGLISLSFRLSLANMLFTSDVMTDHGFIKPKGYTLSPAQPLSQYFQASVRFSYEEYLNDYLLPFYQQGDPGLSRDLLEFEGDLRSIELFLRNSASTFLVTNADDIILRPSDPDYLLSIFKERALIFPRGGHLGNIEEKAVVNHLLNLAQREIKQ